VILALAGPSGAGKSKFVEAAVARFGFVRVPADTTRPPRIGEVDGVHYHFDTKAEFRNRIVGREFVDWDYTIGNYYGYRREVERYADCGESVALAVVARMAVRLYLHLPRVFLLFVDGDDEVLDGRLASRSYSEVELELRNHHRDEEREHAALFHDVVPREDVLDERSVERWIARAKEATGC
jgi:guanylate kinase